MCQPATALHYQDLSEIDHDEGQNFDSFQYDVNVSSQEVESTTSLFISSYICYYIVSTILVLISLFILMLLFQQGRIRRYLNSRYQKKKQKYAQEGFDAAVEFISQTVIKDQTEASTLEPSSGLYKVIMKHQEIYHEPSRTTVYGDGPPQTFIVDLQLTIDLNMRGWKINANRYLIKNNTLCAVLSGFVSYSGKAYWVEKNVHGSGVQILATGEFNGDSFKGEWMTSEGVRGRYWEFERWHQDV